jgi:hypothetical protein
MRYVNLNGTRPFSIVRTIMIPQQPSRKPRKDSLYSVEEMNILKQHKLEYRSQPTRELRGQIFRNKILVDIFNFWESRGLIGPDETDTQNRIKVMVTLPYHLDMSYFNLLGTRRLDS